MTFFGRNGAEVQSKIARTKRTASELCQRGMLIGTPSQFVEQLTELAEAGVQRIMLQWLDLDDLDRLTALANIVVQGTFLSALHLVHLFIFGAAPTGLFRAG